MSNDPLDFSSFEQAAVAKANSTGQAIIRFEERSEPDPAKTQQEGRPVYKTVHYACIRNPGSRDEYVTKVNDTFFRQYGRAAYDKWCETQAQPEEGTPLSMWPPIPKNLVEEWKYFHVYTVEQLAGMNDTAVQRMGMGVLEWRKKAIAWLEDAKTGAASQRLVSENERLTREVERLTRQVQDLMSRMDTLPATPVAAAPAVDINAIAALVAQQMKNGAAQ